MTYKFFVCHVIDSSLSVSVSSLFILDSVDVGVYMDSQRIATCI